MAKRYIKEKGLVRAVTTDSLNLEKPLVNEHYDIDVHNRNMDKLDSAIKEDKSKISSLESNVNENKKSILDAQTKQGDLSQLKTSNKTNLVNAVNELFQNANDGKSTIANSVGSPLLASDTFSAMGTKINTIKSQLATAITGKGVSSSSSDTFATMTNKIGQINTGKKYASGLFQAGQRLEIRGLPFKPRIIHIGEEHGGEYRQYIRNADYGGTVYFMFYSGSGRKNTGFTQYEDGFAFPNTALYQQYWYAFE